MNYLNYQVKGKILVPDNFSLHLFACNYFIYLMCVKGLTTAPQSTAQSSKAIKLIIVLTQSTDETIYTTRPYLQF